MCLVVMTFAGRHISLKETRQAFVQSKLTEIVITKLLSHEGAQILNWINFLNKI